MIVDDYDSILYSLVEVVEGANSTVRSVISVESTVEPSDAAVEKHGFSGADLGDILMQVIPDTESVSRFRSRWNPSVLKLRMYLGTGVGGGGKLMPTFTQLMEPSIRLPNSGKDFDSSDDIGGAGTD